MNKKYPGLKYWGNIRHFKFVVDNRGRDDLLQEGIAIVNSRHIESYGLPRDYWRDGKYYFRIQAPYLQYYCYKGQWYSRLGKPFEAAYGKFDYYSFPPQKELEAMRSLGYSNLSRHQSKRLAYWEDYLRSAQVRVYARLWRRFILSTL